MTEIDFKNNEKYQILRDCEPGFYIRDDMQVIFHVVCFNGQKYFTCIDSNTINAMVLIDRCHNANVIPISIDKILCTRKG